MTMLVSTSWLAAHLADDDLLILDASYFLPDAGRDARAEHAAGHIPGAVFMDLARLKDDSNPLPAMMPDCDQFRAHAQALGLRNTGRIVLYDDAPHHTSARAWVMLRHFGFDDVSVLDGGLARWREEGRPLETGFTTPREGHINMLLERPDIRTLADVRANIDSGREQIVDARGPARFSGEEQETRPGLASGHIPGSCNLPYDRLFNADGTWKQGDALREAFTAAQVDLDRPMVTSCGSGITASALIFGAALLGKHDTALYDGSWTEWGADPATPKAVGPA